MIPCSTAKLASPGRAVPHWRGRSCSRIARPASSDVAEATMFSIAARTSPDAGRGDKDKASQSQSSQQLGRRHASITLHVCNVFCSQANPFPMPRTTEAVRAGHRHVWLQGKATELRLPLSSNSHVSVPGLAVSTAINCSCGFLHSRRRNRILSDHIDPQSLCGPACIDREPSFVNLNLQLSLYNRNEWQRNDL